MKTTHDKCFGENSDINKKSSLKQCNCCISKTA